MLKKKDLLLGEATDPIMLLVPWGQVPGGDVAAKVRYLEENGVLAEGCAQIGVFVQFDTLEIGAAFIERFNAMLGEEG